MATKAGVQRLQETVGFMVAHGARGLSQLIDMAMTSEARRAEAGDAIKMDYVIKTDSDRARQAIHAVSIHVRGKEIPREHHRLGRRLFRNRTGDEIPLATQERQFDHGWCQGLPADGGAGLHGGSLGAYRAQPVH